jgi:putative copper resistance protein D
MRSMGRSGARSNLARVPVVVVAWLAAAGPVAAHGEVPDAPPTVANLLLGWSFPVLPTLGILAAVAWWTWAVGRVNAVHPDNRVPRRRSVAFGAGMVALALALGSGIERYDTTLFSVHMVQHLLLTMVAAPLIALAAPITLLLRLAAPVTRQRIVLPILHSRILRFVTFPAVAWIAFAGVMWATHFSPLFDAALEDPIAHDLEHALFLGTALLFWWPAVNADPNPWRMSHPVRALYTFLQMPQNTFLAVVLLSANAPLYPHYATLDVAWRGSAIDDQRLAAGVMWLGGDALFIVAVGAIVWGWMRAEEAATERSDRRADAELAIIRTRETALAERRAERADSAEG